MNNDSSILEIVISWSTGAMEVCVPVTMIVQTVALRRVSPPYKDF
jgi:hypothetical protein